ncbi:MAG: hypothetical protein ABFE02_04840 [Sulfuricella sp.]
MKTQTTIAISLHQQRMIQMKTQPTISVRLLSAVIGVFIVTMTIIFLTVPYAMSSHPGEPLSKAVSTESIHPI